MRSFLPDCRSRLGCSSGGLLGLLLIGLILIAGQSAALSSDAVLKEPVQFDLVINGKTVGSTKVPAGTKVTVVDRDGSRVRIAHGSGRETWVEQTQVEGVEEHNPEREYREARVLLNEEDKGGNWDRAFELMRRAAEAGFPAAQRDWGVMLGDGFGVKQNLEESERFLLLAAEAGDGRALLEMSNLFLGSDREKASHLLKKAADEGDPSALIMTAGSDWNSQALLEKAFDSQDQFARLIAASRYAQVAKNPEQSAEFGMSKDELYMKSAAAYRDASEAGIVEANLGLAELMREGHGVAQDKAGSDALLISFKRILEQRFRRGSLSAALTLITGLRNTSFALDRSEALKLLSESLERTDYPPQKSAICGVAANVIVGSGTDNPDDLREAIVWLEKVPPGPSADGVAPLIEKHRAALAELEAKPDASAVFNGTWDTNFGKLTLRQNSNEVEGEYSGNSTGTIKGRVTEGRLEYSWKQTNGDWGSGVFRLFDGGRSIAGTWGKESSADGGGKWTGTRSVAN